MEVAGVCVSDDVHKGRSGQDGIGWEAPRPVSTAFGVCGRRRSIGMCVAPADELALRE